MGEPKSLRAALVLAQRTVDAASKDAKNEHHRYDYASAEEIVSVASVALSGAGLAFAEERSAFVPFGAELLRERAASKDRAQSDGLGGALGLLTVTYGLIHAESGERSEVVHDFPVVPEKGRPLDKALAASRTECLAYALRGLLLIERRPKDQKGKPKRARGTPPLDVSGRNDQPEPQTPPPVVVAPKAAEPPPVAPRAAEPPPPAAPRVEEAAQSRSARPESAPTPAPEQIEAAALIAPILNASTLKDGIAALTVARANKAIKGEDAERAFASFILRKIEAAKAGDEASVKLNRLVEVESHLVRAGIGAEANRRCREALKAANAEVRGR
jgi:hypothetical protein